MRIIGLLINMPKQKPPGPLRTHKRVFSAHGIEITTPQQLVVLLLRQKRQHLNMQLTSLAHSTNLQSWATQPSVQIIEDTAFGHQQ